MDHGSARGWRWVVFFAHSGDSWFWLLGLVLVWFAGSPEWHNRAALFAVGLVFLAVLVLAIKFSVRRSRPEGDWGAVYRSTDPHSFPSGHAARATLFAVLALGVGPAWLAVVLLAWAPLVSLSRVALGVHFLSDVMAGTLIGVVIGAAILATQPWIMRWLWFLFAPLTG
jgi:undecaprenyl-diphosphatase